MVFYCAIRTIIRETVEFIRMIEFSGVGPDGENLTAPDGSIIGIIEEGSPEIAARVVRDVVRLSAGDPVPDAPGNYLLDHMLSFTDAVTKAKAVSCLVSLRRAGATIALIGHDEALLESCADEIWWLSNGGLVARGDPADVVAGYRRHVAEVLRESGRGEAPGLSPTMRNGDGRAVLEQVELLDADAVHTVVFRSGEPMQIWVTVRFTSPVADPVVGIMIRTRIGLNVYGTNTELEKVKLGPVAADDRRRVSYRFRCDLCPGDYTITAASHDPDGVWHDWMEDAVAFAVTDSRYTAGVANLKAKVEAEGS
jgi:lipopolysaccharide transport system ATP-binding protein